MGFLLFREIRNWKKLKFNFAKHLTYFAKFRHVKSFAKEISRNFVKSLDLRKKFCKTSSNTYSAKWFCRDIARIWEILFVLHEISSYNQFCEWNFAKFRKILSIAKEIVAKFRQILSFAKEISRNFVKYLFRKMILPKFREIL